MKYEKRKITLIVSVIAVVVIATTATIVGIRVRQMNRNGNQKARPTTSSNGTKYVTEHTLYISDECQGEIAWTCQTPFNQCYNMKMLQPERNFELDEEKGGFDFSKDAFDRYDKVLIYNNTDGEPLQIQEIHYYTNDGSCSGDQDNTIGGTIGAGQSCDSFTVWFKNASNYSESYQKQLLKI